MGNITATLGANERRPSILDYLDDDLLRLICTSLHIEVQADQQRPFHQQTKVSLKPLSLTCKRFRALCVPYVFQVFRLQFSDGNLWKQAASKLHLWNSGLSSFIHEVDINIALGYEVKWTWFVGSLPGTLAAILEQLSTSSSHLDKVSIQIEAERLHLFAAAFTKHNLVFPRVSKLAIGRPNDGIVKLCPHAVSLSVLDSLVSRDLSSTIAEALNQLPLLKRLHLKRMGVSIDLLDILLSVIPSIQTLALPSRLYMPFEHFVAHISRFPALEVLVIPSAQDLGVGFDPPGCGNCYDGPFGEELRIRVREEGRAAEERVALAIFRQCPQLKELWFNVNIRATMEGEITGENLQWSYYGYYGNGTRDEHWESLF